MPLHRLLRTIALSLLLSPLSRAAEPAPPANQYPIMCWELPPRTAEFSDPAHGLATVAACGFTTAGFVLPDQLPLCEKTGLLAMTCRPEWKTEWRKLTDEQILATVSKRIEDAGNSKALIGYFLEDEPSAADFPALAKAVAAVKKLAPGKLAYINLFPDYATLGATDRSQLGTETYTEYLERYVAEVKPQFISYDNYMVEYSGDLKDPAVAASYYKNLLEVRRVAQKHDLPFWNIVCSNQITPGVPIPSAASLMFQGYTTLAAGANGLTWYTYYCSGYPYAPVDKEGHRTATWAALKLVNDQVKVLGPIMAPLQSTGVYFTSPAPVKSLPTLPGEMIDAVSSPTPIMVGEFTAPAGDRYAMLVNLSLERSTLCKLKPHHPAEKLRAVSPVDGSLSAMPDDLSLWLTAGQGVLIKF